MPVVEASLTLSLL